MRTTTTWRAVIAIAAASGAVIAGCGGGDPAPVDGGIRRDGAPVDARPAIDAPPSGDDAQVGEDDAQVVDPDGDVVDPDGDVVEPDGDVVDPDGGPIVGDGGGGASTAEQIAAVRAATPGALSPALPIAGAMITYVIQNPEPDYYDFEGFFVQATIDGPAVFVEIEPTTVTPEPTVGDVVDFMVTETTLVQGRIHVTAVTAYARTGSGDVSALWADASDVALSAMTDAYESELISVTATLATDFTACGVNHRCAQITTAGVPTASSSLRFRTMEAIVVGLGLRNGCEIEIGPTPMWRFNADAQPSAWAAGDVSVTSCPAPTVVGATATDATTVVVTFDTAIDPSTVTDTAFTLSDGATVSAAVATDATTVTLTTSALTPGTTYTVTVDAAVTDPMGTPVDPAMDTATFVYEVAGTVPGAGELVITEVMANPAGTDPGREWIELYNPSTTATYSLTGCTLADNGGDSHVIGVLAIAPGDYLTLAFSAASGFTADYVYDGDFALNNGGMDGDGVTLTCATIVVDTMSYAGTTNGASISLDPGSLDALANDDPTNWCLGTGMYFESERGTPGTANPDCTL
jgi:hypothetical protein